MYLILTVQLVFTTMMIWTAIEVPEFADFQKENRGFLYFLMFLSIAIAISLFCFSQLSKDVPINYILLFTFTFCEGYLVSFLCTFYDEMVVFQAGILTAGVTIGLTVYAFTTEKDFTTMGAMLFMMLFAVIIIGLLNIFIQSPTI